MAYQDSNTAFKYGLKSLSVALWDPKSKRRINNGDVSIGLGWYPKFNKTTSDIDMWSFVNVSDDKSGVFNFEIIVRFTFWLKMPKSKTAILDDGGILIADTLTVSLIKTFYDVLRGVVFEKCCSRFSSGFVLPDLDAEYVMRSLRIVKLSNRDEEIIARSERGIGRTEFP